MKNFILKMAIIAALLTVGPVSTNAEVTECVEISSLPTSIKTPGIYCLKSNLETNITFGGAITVAADNVTIDLNGWSINGSQAGVGTRAKGIVIREQRNTTIRNGTISGFFNAVEVVGLTTTSSDHLIEKIHARNNRAQGISVSGRDIMVRDNRISNTGPGGFSASAVGIFASGNAISILGNTISDVEETGQISGISLTNVVGGEISDNRIYNLGSSNNTSGITFSGANRLAIRDNTVNTNNGGIIGIGSSSASRYVACVGNVVNGFALNISSNIGSCAAVANNTAF